MAAYVAIVGVVHTATQFAAIIPVFAIAATRAHFDARAWGNRAGSDGFILSLATCAAAITCVPLLRFLTGRHETRPWDFLGLRSVPIRYVALSCGAMAVFIAVSGYVGFLLGRTAPPFMVEIFSGGQSRVFLFVTLVVAAPILEELFFRGFLFGGLVACGAPVPVAVTVVSLAFAAIHLQYDAYDVAIVFLMGLLLIGARVKFGSIVPGLAMHGFVNAVSFAGLALLK